MLIEVFEVESGALTQWQYYEPSATRPKVYLAKEAAEAGFKPLAVSWAGIPSLESFKIKGKNECSIFEFVDLLHDSKLEQTVAKATDSQDFVRKRDISKCVHTSSSSPPPPPPP